MSNCSYLNSNSSSFDADKSNRSFTFYALSLSVSILVAVLAPVAVIGNGFILAAIWRNPSLRTPSYILLAGLAFTDLGTGLITQPVYVAKEVIELQHIITPDGNLTLMVIASGCATFFSNTTVKIMTVLAIERWLHMARRSFITSRRTCFIVAFILILPVPLVAIRTLNNIKKTYQIKADISSITVLVLCLIGTSVAYFKVFRIIRHNQQQIQANTLSQNVAQPRVNFEKYKKSVFTIPYIVALYYLGYFPVIATLWFRLTSNHLKLQELVLNVSFVFVVLCSSLNPLLYVWRMRDIRNEVKQLVKRILCKN